MFARTCNDLATFSLLVEPSHRLAQVVARDVEVGVRRGQARMAEHLPHVMQRHAAFEEARAGFVSEIVEAEVSNHEFSLFLWWKAGD